VKGIFLSLAACLAFGALSLKAGSSNSVMRSTVSDSDETPFLHAQIKTTITKPTPTPAPKQHMPIMLSFTEMNWTSLPERPGMQYALLSGNPKDGAYTQMRKVPAGTDNGLHSHSSELTNIIISGVWYTGTDASSAKDFGPGSIVMMPGDWVHVSGCRPVSECVFYQEGKGKFDFKPVASNASEMKPDN